MYYYEDEFFSINEIGPGFFRITCLITGDVFFAVCVSKKQQAAILNSGRGRKIRHLPDKRAIVVL